MSAYAQHTLFFNKNERRKVFAENLGKLFWVSVSYDENQKKKQYKRKSVTAAIQIGQTKSGTGTTNLYTFGGIF